MCEEVGGRAAAANTAVNLSPHTFRLGQEQRQDKSKAKDKNIDKNKKKRGKEKEKNK